VLFNAALALLRRIEHRGWSGALARQARTLIERARDIDPASGRLATLAEYMHVLIGRNGVVADDSARPVYRRARG
jgi:hypothetical protein